MSKTGFIILLLALCAQAQAEVDIGDYAFQAVISEHDQKLQRVELPLEVILTLTRSDLGDLVVLMLTASKCRIRSW